MIGSRLSHPLLAAAALQLAAAAPTPAPLTFDTILRSPLPLAEQLLGRSAAGIVEAQAVPVPGVAQFQGLQLYFAPHAHATDRAGLCRLEMQQVALPFVEPRDDAGTLRPEPPETITYYALTGPAPDLGMARADSAGNETACGRLTPFLNRENWHIAPVRFAGRDADPAQAAFAFRAMAAARETENFHPNPCPSGDSPACVDPQAFRRATDLRDLSYIRVEHCPSNAASFCVIGTFDDPARGGFVELRAELDGADLPSVNLAPRVRAASLQAGRFPVF